MKNSTHQALSESTYYILLSLHTPQHGYGIMQFVKQLSNNRLTLAPGTLYGAITALLDKKWIEPKEKETTDRKKVYVITALGQEALQTEIARLAELYQNGLAITKGEE
ncbi:Transcriptional regulator PadR-like family protein [Bacillus sp. THAF10]|uniref:PadR family transcriptional regulator n=1 Tax=Bacillus sp. THAF10 TaxID=2587848 RepID=UPI0012685EC7|nr:helix-turn-helix transcriptional regulator [Bacillus sp. THAF10]QFT87420.1 Transcriptional regulator PadR-like family protein [Bacillus sp. THAF10]